MRSLLLFIFQPFSYYFIWNNKSKHYLVPKFFIANGIVSLAGLGLLKLYLISLNTPKVPSYTQNPQIEVPINFFIAIAIPSIVSIFIGLSMKKKVSEKKMIVGLIFSILLPYLFMLVSSSISQAMLANISSDFKQMAQREVDLNKPLDPLVMARYPSNPLPEEVRAMRGRDFTRTQDLNLILAAMLSYKKANRGKLPEEVTGEWRDISKDDANICSYLIPTYIDTLPQDPPIDPVNNPSTGYISVCYLTYNTRYQIRYVGEEKKIVLSAPMVEAENELIVSE